MRTVLSETMGISEPWGMYHLGNEIPVINAVWKCPQRLSVNCVNVREDPVGN